MKRILSIIKGVQEQNKVQLRLNALIGKRKKADYIKLRLPKTHIALLEVLALYGINDSIQLMKILDDKLFRLQLKADKLKQNRQGI